MRPKAFVIHILEMGFELAFCFGGRKLRACYEICKHFIKEYLALTGLFHNTFSI